MFTDIPGFPFYQITPDGDVLDGVTGEFRPTYVAGPGYWMVHLKHYDEDGEVLDTELVYVHRLLAATYLANPNNYRDVDHIDRNRLNNALSNLRWCPHRVNCENKGLYKNNTLKEANIYWDEPNDRYVCRIKRNGHRVSRSFKTLEGAKDYRVSRLGH